MMTPNELKDYRDMNNKFISECERVAKVLGGLIGQRNNIHYAETFRLEDDEVYWEGRDYRGDEVWGYFPVEYLTMSDLRLEKMVGEMNADYIRKLEEARKEHEKNSTKEQRRKQYEELKKEFEKE